MAQPSVASYFNTRKRTAYEDVKISQAKKVLVLDSTCDRSDGLGFAKNVGDGLVKQDKEPAAHVRRIVTFTPPDPKPAPRKPQQKPRTTKSKHPAPHHYKDIQLLLSNMKKAEEPPPPPPELTSILPSESEEIKRHVTPPSTPRVTVKNALDKVKDKPDGPSLKEIRRKMTRSSRLAELKASISKLQEGASKLREVEERTKKIPVPESPKLKTFKSIELEVELSPKKVFSPEKAYLSPKKDVTVKRNLLHLFSPTKNAAAVAPESPSKQILAELSKPALILPYKYRYLAEIFRCVDQICQILYNRKETITFKKIKPCVEEMLKRSLMEKHLAQIKRIYPDAFTFTQEKLRVFGVGTKRDEWALVLRPAIDGAEQFTSDILLQRRRKLFGVLLDRVKDYHEEFLSNLDPPMTVPRDKVTRWHPEFDIERVPDVEAAELPQSPDVEPILTAKDVLDRAKQMFNCNTRMEQALERLREAKEKDQVPESVEKTKAVPESVLKGIPKALLEKVRQKQAAKALASITRSVETEKEVEKYSRLPEIARLTRNLFVSEKKSVLPLETVIDKLGNCYRTYLTKSDMEEHLKLISAEFPKWLVFHLIRNCMYVKLAKNDDLSVILNHLENLAKQKSET